MAGIQTGIELNDGFTNVMYGIIESVYAANYAMYDFQDTMNEAVDVSSYDQISNDIEEAAYQQNNFNREIKEGISSSSDLLDSIKGVVAAYASIQTIKQVVELSDTMTQTTARLELIVDDGGNIEELQNKIYASAQNARGLYLATADAVSKLGMQAGDVFSSNDELIAFTELLNKQFVNAGTSAQGIDSVMLQLTQSMAAGRLQGEELNAVLDNAAPIVQDIQRYLEEVQGIDASNIKELASEGVLTADVVKSAMFYAADEINAKFESMPMTWGQAWDLIQNGALVAFQPVLQKINDFANSNVVQLFVNVAIESMAVLANMVLNVFDFMASCGQFVADNWSIIEPIILGVTAAFGVYTAALVAYNTVQAISNGLKFIATVQEYAHAKSILANAGAYSAETIATASATVAQASFNTVLAACPLTWIILLIIALIAVIFAVCSAIAKMTGVAESGFGVICGGVNVVIQFFKNLGLSVANIALGIGSAIAALASNIMTAFHNAICNVQSWWYDLLSTCLSVIESICAALNKLPFVEFDYSGISSAADDYAAKASEAAGNKEEYTSISDAFNEGVSTFDTFQDGWVSDAFHAGASWGDCVAEAVDNFSLSDLFGSTDIPNVQDHTSQFTGLTDSLDGISTDTGNISDALEVTEEELKYMRDIAEQEAVNRFTIAEVTINQTNNNTINNGQDLDGFVSDLTDAVNEAVDIMAEGVHE